MKVIAIANQNGGVGKTTCVHNLAAALGEAGQRVLAVDTDPSATLTMSMGYNPDELERTLYDSFRDPAYITKDSVLRVSSNVSLIPANLDMAGLEVELRPDSPADRGYLKDILRGLKGYDIALLDTPPSLGMITLNALHACDAVIAPVPCQYLRLRGLQLLINTVEGNRPGLPWKVLPTFYFARGLHFSEALATLRESYGDRVFNTVIRFTVRLAEAPIRGESILDYDGKSIHATAFKELSEEVLNWLKERR